ncbi:MAG: 50S ribosomal protein L23 [candidate division WOR-3 bacterium]
MKLTYEDIIIEPVITEKALNLRDTQNKYIFIVHKDANKRQIKEAVEKIFKVKVKKVNTMVVKPKPKRGLRNRLKVGYTSSYKKAVVTLEEGYKIDLEV